MGRFAAMWGVLGFMAVLVFAIARLSVYAWEAVAAGLTGFQWFVLLLNLVFMAYSEGYRGFQLGFSPRLAARALYLYRNPSFLTALLAPLFCVGYMNAGLRVKVVVWCATIGIVVLVVLVNLLVQPWRGIIDAGVVLGLTWGLISLGVSVYMTFRHGRYYHSPQIPGVDVDIAQTR
jgi:hypothetical protein